jgi:hypothetical protein
MIPARRGRITAAQRPDFRKENPKRNERLHLVRPQGKEREGKLPESTEVASLAEAVIIGNETAHRCQKLAPRSEKDDKGLKGG